MNNAGEAPLVPRVLSGVFSRVWWTREAQRRKRPWDGVRPKRERGCSPPAGRESTRRKKASRREDAGRVLSGLSTLQDALAKLNPGSSDLILQLSLSASSGSGACIIIMAFDFPTGLNSEKVAALIHKLNSDPQFVLAQNVGTTHDLLDICLKRATVQGAQHVFQHVVPQEGKPVTNQKSSGEVFDFLPT